MIYDDSSNTPTGFTVNPNTTTFPIQTPDFTDSEKDHILSIKHLLHNSLTNWWNICKTEYMAKNTPKGIFGRKQPPLINPPNIFISGGLIASLLVGEPPNDVDIFFKAKDEQELFKKIYSDILKNDVAVYSKYVTKPYAKDTSSGFTANAINLNPDKYSQTKYQLILCQVGDPEDVTSSFDFVHCQAYYDWIQNSLYISPLIYKCCVNKILYNPHTSQKFLHSPKRIKKFMDRGFKLRTGFSIPNITPLNSTDVGKDYIYIDEFTPRRMQEQYIEANIKT